MTRPQPDKPAIEGGTPVRTEPLPFFRASLTDADVDGVVETLRSGWLTVGPKTVRLEELLRDYLGVSHAIAVSSCSEAMFLALKTLGVGEGDQVVTSSLTFASTVHAIIHTGATPVIVDVETDTLGPDPDALEAAITPETRALLPVHFGGQACRIDDICKLARDRGLFVVEDAAHSFGARAGGKAVGGHGDAVAFSFYATKNMTTAEGGAVTTDDEALARKLRLWSYHGMSRDSWERYEDRGSWYYEVNVPGYKCNMSDLLAALGLSQMERIGTLLDNRRRVAGWYLDRLRGRDYLELPREADGNWHTWHLFVVQLCLDRLTIDRNRFIAALTEEKIGNSVHFIPVQKHPFFKPYLTGEQYPVCEGYYSRCLSLPLFPDMTESDVDDVVAALDRIASFYRAD